MLKYNLSDDTSWGFGSVFLYEGFEMTDAEQREAARQFINSWRKGGGEKQDCHMYWMQLLQDVLGAHMTDLLFTYCRVTHFREFSKMILMDIRCYLS